MHALLVALGAMSICLPAIFLAIAELLPTFRARRHEHRTAAEVVQPIDDFTVIVPIYGDVKYLENVDYLRDYGDRVLLTTTTTETPEFDRQLDEIAAANGLRVFRGTVPGREAVVAGGKRQTGGVIREHIVRQAVNTVTTKYVVCIDADTDTERPLSLLVGALVHHDFEVASVRLVVKNRVNLITRLQSHEYRNAMRLRHVVPWLVSGACHVATTDAHRRIMNQHSTFFQGNDVEVGVLGDALEFRVGHLPFPVPTSVPPTWRGWFRQRLAWSGGEVRLYVVNLHLARRHPFLFLYGFGSLITTPLRWWCLINPSWPVAASLTTYLLIVAVVNFRDRDPALLVMPLYLMIINMIIVPMGLWTYVRMAWADRNIGVIQSSRPRMHSLRALPRPDLPPYQRELTDAPTGTRRERVFIAGRLTAERWP